MRRAAIISGGGRKGAYFAGLLSVTKPKYETVYGNSAKATQVRRVFIGEGSNVTV